MLFPTHLVAAYLLGRRWDFPVVPIVAGAALPDLIDKPLASLGMVDLFHTVSHSGLAVSLLAVVPLVSTRSASPRSEWWLALWLGWATHLLLDATQMIVNGRPEDTRFLLWPFVRHTPAVDLPPVEFALDYRWTPAFFAELVIWLYFLLGVVGEIRSSTEGGE